MTPEITQEELKRLLHYDPETGVFTWIAKACCKVRIGGRAGCRTQHGYWQLKVNKKLYRAHRLAWFYQYGEMPPNGVDHINGDKCDNRIANLRLATDGENIQNQKRARSNNVIGLLGVCFSKQAKKWHAQISKNGLRIHLGYFLTPEEAHQEYLRAKRIVHPFGTL